MISEGLTIFFSKLTVILNLAVPFIFAELNTITSLNCRLQY